MICVSFVFSSKAPNNIVFLPHLSVYLGSWYAPFCLHSFSKCVICFVFAYTIGCNFDVFAKSINEHQMNIFMCVLQMLYHSLLLYDARKVRVWMILLFLKNNGKLKILPKYREYMDRKNFYAITYNKSYMKLAGTKVHLLLSVCYYHIYTVGVIPFFCNELLLHLMYSFSTVTKRRQKQVNIFQLNW